MNKGKIENAHPTITLVIQILGKSSLHLYCNMHLHPSRPASFHSHLISFLHILSKTKRLLWIAAINTIMLFNSLEKSIFISKLCHWYKEVYVSFLVSIFFPLYVINTHTHSTQVPHHQQYYSHGLIPNCFNEGFNEWKCLTRAIGALAT